MERKLMIGQHKIGIFAALFFLAGFLSMVGAGFAEEATPVGTVRQVEATVVHVDQYAVYAPNLVFYFDTRMEKRKIESLMRVADRLRNKKALITCFSAGEDERVLLLDIVPALEKLTSGKPPRETPKQAGDRQEKPGLKLSGEEMASTDAKPGEPQDSSEQTIFQEKKRPRPAVPAPVTGQEKPGLKLSGEEMASTDAKSGEPQDSSKQTIFQEKKHPRPAGPAPITGDEVTGFVRELLELNGMKDLSAVAPFYADKVDYYDRGLVSRDEVRKDLGYYFRNWDNIATSLDGDVVVTPADQPEVRIARFISSFSVENKKKALTGKTENVWKIQRIDGKLRLIDVKQRIISRESFVVQ
jgi:hypothetical protein